MAQAYKPLPHASELWELFAYKPLTGELVRKQGVQGGDISGLAGGLTSNGYVSLCFKGQKYQAHRVVWCWVTGSDAGAFEVDHQDRNRSNNRFSNLRLANSAENKYNASKRPHSKQPLKGVERTQAGSYRARIRVGGIRRSLGTYGTAEEAGAAYAKAAAELHGEFACTE